MGLDMFLTTEHYVRNSDTAGKIKSLFPELEGWPGAYGDREDPDFAVQVEAGYWRKANAVHQWFVTNVQNGEDDCGRYYVSRDQLRELRDLCIRVRDFGHLATEQLPPSQGFFWGSATVDDTYWYHIDHTIEIIERALALPDAWHFEYHSSW